MLPRLSDVQSMPDPAPSWMWTMDIFMRDVRLISDLYVLEVNFPFAYIDAVSRFRAGKFLYFPGHQNIDNPTVSFYEREDFALIRAFKRWQAQVRDIAGNYAMPKDYLGTAVLHLYDTRGQERARCNLFGVWPTRLGDWQMNYSGSQHLQVQVTFSCNDSAFEFFDTGGQQVSGISGNTSGTVGASGAVSAGNFDFSSLFANFA